MHKILRAIALMFALQTAAMADTLPATRAEAPAAGGLMHANLVVTAQRKGESPALAAELQPEAAPAAEGPEQERRDHTTGMLLAALALMAGIVLRRWGSSQQ